MSRAQASEIREILGGAIAAPAAAAAERLARQAEAEGLIDVAYTSFESPIGSGLVAATERGIVSIGLPNSNRDAFLGRLARDLSPRILERPARFDEARRELEQYFEGERRTFELELDWQLVRSEFSSRVLHETAKLPYGVTASYGEVAARAGNPRAYRAAGTALGHNPIPIVVPCHRVLRAHGLLGQYGGGPEMKEFFLRLEGALD
jgi:methylated-DNA-[protein]-cysteine S-methyltransferase